MNRAEYLAALAALGLSRGHRVTAALLGLTQRQLSNYATGACPIAPPVSRLVRLLLRQPARGPEALAALAISLLES